MLRRLNKYRNVPTTADGVRFASAKEARRYRELLLLEQAGEIFGLILQPRFPLSVNGVKVCVYIGDFEYREDDRTVVEDVKSPITKKNRAYVLKRKLLKACLGIDVREI